jgi:sigma-B regulation protein RsbU (phosphoserine phosphatase)
VLQVTSSCACRAAVPGFAADGEWGAAARLQQALLPPPYYSWGSWSAAHRYSPAGVVGGDIVDLIPADDRLYFVLADVSGKGAAASLLTAYVHAVFRSLVPFGLPLEEVVRRASALLCASTLPSQYATLVFGYAGGGGEIVLANAGHPPPLVIGSRGTSHLVPTGTAAGMFCDSQFGTTRVDLDPGDSLFLYSDGLTEAFDRREQEYGADRLIAAARRAPDSGPSALIERVGGDLAAFLDGVPPGDDLTMLALRYDLRRRSG